MFHVKHFGTIGNDSPAGKAGLLASGLHLLPMVVPAVPMMPATMPVVPTVPVRFFHPLRRRGCAHDTLVHGRHCGRTAFPESQGAEQNSGRDSDFCKACAHDEILLV
jgi:hypothetical protein